ncbi:hypothetical protein [Komagataeibacter xylinus]|uniref:hypothetical protein n=1 Tax=Komagataeibacter xylinus TaxID=28448 RepID=UPI0010302F79|nr:hypothetical protein [Komagataeibacter xylinus]
MAVLATALFHCENFISIKHHQEFIQNQPIDKKDKNFQEFSFFEKSRVVRSFMKKASPETSFNLHNLSLACCCDHLQGPQQPGWGAIPPPGVSF